MQIALRLNQREIDAVLRAELSAGHGVRRSNALMDAEFKIREALINARRDDRIGAALRKDKD